MIGGEGEKERRGQNPEEGLREVPRGGDQMMEERGEESQEVGAGRKKEERQSPKINEHLCHSGRKEES